MYKRISTSHEAVYFFSEISCRNEKHRNKCYTFLTFKETVTHLITYSRAPNFLEQTKLSQVVKQRLKICTRKFLLNPRRTTFAIN